jgi:hypothetical protein
MVTVDPFVREGVVLVRLFDAVLQLKFYKCNRSVWPCTTGVFLFLIL